MRPLIGVCASHIEDKRQFFVNQNYMDSLLRAGALPVLLPMTTEQDVLQEMVDRIDGLFLAGGGDVDPQRYGEEMIPQCEKPDPLRDGFELGLLPLAMEKGIPVFGVCRGIQVLNVYFGGTLYQDIPTQCPGTEIHMQEPPYDQRVHSINVVPGSLLEQILGSSTFEVNSTHHQSIKTPGKGMVIDARSPEGIIEGIHLADNPKVYGVQFHPERFADRVEGAQNLFNYLVSCAK